MRESTKQEIKNTKKEPPVLLLRGEKVRVDGVQNSCTYLEAHCEFARVLNENGRVETFHMNLISKQS